MKIPNDSITRPWLGMRNFFNAFHYSFDALTELSATKPFIMPTNQRLIEILKNCFDEFKPIFESMQKINEPTLHLPMINLMKLNKAFSKWPARLSHFGEKLVISLKIK